MEGFDFSLAPHGLKVVNGTTEVTNLNAKAIYVAEDSVISSIKYKGSGTNVVSNHISDPGNTVKQFIIITPDDGQIIDAITLSSGSVGAIKAK